MGIKHFWIISSPRIAASVVMILSLLRGFLLAGLIPAYHGPDERPHFDYAQRIAETGCLPELRIEGGKWCSDEADAVTMSFLLPIVFHPWIPLPPLELFNPPDPCDPKSRLTSGRGAAAFYPPFYYATVSAGYLSVYSKPFLTRLFAGRLISVVWGCVTSLTAFLMGFYFFGRVEEGLLIGLLVTFQPMIGMLSSVVNNDAALIAMVAASLAAIAALSRSVSALSLVALSASMTVGILSKPTFVIYIPVIFIGSILALGPNRIGSSECFRGVLTLIIPALVLLIWSVYSHNAAIERITGNNTEMPFGKFLHEIVFNPHRLYLYWIKEYWMTWGYLDTNLPKGYYHIIAISLCLAVIGVAIGWRTLLAKEQVVIVAGAVATLFSLAVLYYLELIMIRNTGEEFIQGRYLVPLFPLHAIMIVIGLRAFSKGLRIRIDGAWTFVALVITLMGASILQVLVRFYV